MKFLQYLYVCVRVLSGCNDENPTSSGSALNSGGGQSVRRGANNTNPKTIETDPVLETDMAKKFKAEYRRLVDEAENLKEEDVSVCDHGEPITINDAGSKCAVPSKYLSWPSLGGTLYESSPSPSRRTYLYFFANRSHSKAFRDHLLEWKAFKTVTGDAMDGLILAIHTDIALEGDRTLPPVCRTFNLVMTMARPPPHVTT